MQLAESNAPGADRLAEMSMSSPLPSLSMNQTALNELHKIFSSCLSLIAASCNHRIADGAARILQTIDCWFFFTFSRSLLPGALGL